jgi:hypothetical protein
VPLSLSAEYQNSVDAFLLNLSQHVPRKRLPTLSLCWPETGKSFPSKGGLFVIGRATNGFGNTFEFEDLPTDATRRAAIEKARKNAESYALSWVASGNGYKSGTIGTRSAFWRTVRATFEVVTPAPTNDNWYHSIAWSNLAKVAPAASGNPSNWLGQSQSPGAWELTLQEIDELDPRVILLITGNWMDESRLDRIDAKARRNSKFVKHSSNHGGRKWLIVERPEHQNQRAVIEEIQDASKELD